MPKYIVQPKPEVISQDLPALPPELETAFKEEYTPILAADPIKCSGYPNHALEGRLKGYRTFDIDFNGVSYRLVYQIRDSPAPRRVVVVSFDEHDPAYEKAKMRIKKKK